MTDYLNKYSNSKLTDLDTSYNDIDTNSNDSNNSIILPTTLNVKNKILLENIDSFYQNNYNFDILYKHIVHKKISLRIIDWFVTNYSKKYNTVINNNFIVFLEYKSQLKAYTKKIFDPFCRRERIIRNYNNIKINTTLGQLNFFKWAILNNILDYIKTNLELIEKDMTVKSNNTQIKMNKNNIDIQISFD